MNKYIDADKLNAEIERLNSLVYYESKDRHDEGLHDAYKAVKNVIDSLQQEQPEDIVVVAKTFLDVLSKTPYNNKPITDAQTIVKQLLLFFENPKEYNPDAILEQPEVDLEKEIDRWFSEKYMQNMEGLPIKLIVKMIAHYFFELGLNTQKGK